MLISHGVMFISLLQETYSAYEQQKLYTHILQKDLKLLRDNKSYERANATYYEHKKNDLFYKTVTGTRMLGADGNFDEIDNITTYNRWKMTTKPYGAVAHRKYMEWKDHISGGQPTQRQYYISIYLLFGFLTLCLYFHSIADRDNEFEKENQIKRVRMLWDDIRYNDQLLSHDIVFERFKLSIDFNS